MQVTETLTEGLRRGFSVILPADELQGRRDKRLAELGQDLKLPGFRPGKVPLSVVRQRYGSAVRAEVLEQSVTEATEKLLQDRGLRPAMQPKVDLQGEPDKDGNDLAFTVEMELLPEIAIPDLGAISLTRLVAVPSDETIDKALGEIARRNRTLTDVEESRPAVRGDIVVADFTGRIDGVPFEGGAASDVPIEVGGDGFIPGFTEQLEGMSAGETRTIDVTFPEEYQAAELAGKAAQFEIVAKSLKISTLPEIDDELAKKVGFEEIAKVRDVVREQMTQEYRGLSRMRIKRELLDALAEKTDFEAPPTMVEAEFAQIWARVDADRTAGKLDEEDRDKDEATLRADYRAIAERRVKLGLLLAEVGRLNGIQVSQDEMFRAMRAEAGRYPGQEQAVMDFFRKNPQAAETLRGPIYENKVVDYVLELAKVEEREVTPEELAESDDEVEEIAA
jgi:trigger factor